MVLHCLLVGCNWAQPIQVRLGHEQLLCQRCSRCASTRYRAVSADQADPG